MADACNFCGATPAPKHKDAGVFLCAACAPKLANARLRYGGKALKTWAKQRSTHFQEPKAESAETDTQDNSSQSSSDSAKSAKRQSTQRSEAQETPEAQ